MPLNHFIGYGRREARIWLLGLEERVTIPAEVNYRLKVLTQLYRGHQNAENPAPGFCGDVRELHEQYLRHYPDGPEFKEACKKIQNQVLAHLPTLQPTWDKLIVLLAGIAGYEPDSPPPPAIRRLYQRDFLGRSAITCEVMLAELFPCPLTNHSNGAYIDAGGPALFHMDYDEYINQSVAMRVGHDGVLPQSVPDNVVIIPYGDVPQMQKHNGFLPEAIRLPNGGNVLPHPRRPIEGVGNAQWCTWGRQIGDALDKNLRHLIHQQFQQCHAVP